MLEQDKKGVGKKIFGNGISQQIFGHKELILVVLLDGVLLDFQLVRRVILA